MQEHVWQAMDAKFTINDAEVLAWQSLPVMTDDMLDALRAQSELEHVTIDNSAASKQTR